MPEKEKKTSAGKAAMVKYILIGICAAVVIAGFVISAVLIANKAQTESQSSGSAVSDSLTQSDNGLSDDVQSGSNGQSGADTQSSDPQSEESTQTAESQGDSSLDSQDGDTQSAAGGDTQSSAAEQREVVIYYLDNGAEKTQSCDLSDDPKTVFNKWAELNRLDENTEEEIKLYSVSEADNSWEEETENGTVYHEATVFVLNITVSDNLQEYGENSDMLVETLKKTISGCRNKSYDRIDVFYVNDDIQPIF